MQPLTQQIAAFVLIIILGMLIGIFYDLYRVIRNFWHPKAKGTVLGDALFWFLITILGFSYLIFSTWGEVRIYVFLAIALGAWLYFRIFSGYVRVFLLGMFSFLLGFLHTVFKILKIPLKICRQVVQIPFRFLGYFVLSVGKGLRKIAAGIKLKKPPCDPPQNL